VIRMLFCAVALLTLYVILYILIIDRRDRLIPKSIGPVTILSASHHVVFWIFLPAAYVELKLRSSEFHEYRYYDYD
jgi:uncharacterized membrane protein YqjE